ncbi:cytochrome P450 [Sphingomonas sp. SORGH_AS 950]|uniref:cytochrome P450 n=1 Tax=Sphingomonas sp. SORGH_AS_0950 TaxID=3041792 RepID=UPI002781A5A6|nr:cytochrome P450 [Sphingomonas sp. SORGH_AS_0950]MDQ1158970.1 cytochrome P450 [Sphingomonas sp. SORGH_AS_0950]
MTDAPWSYDLPWPIDLPPFDPFDLAIQADPFRHYAWLRTNAPIVRAGRPDAPIYFVSRYDDVLAGLKDAATFVSTPPGGAIIPGLLLMLDPPLHGPMRQTIGRAFGPRAVNTIEDRVRTLVATHWDRFLVSGGGDAAAGFATPLTMGVIATVLGITIDDAAQMRDWTNSAVDFIATRIRGVVNPHASVDSYAAMRAFMADAMDRAAGDRAAGRGRDTVIDALAVLRDERALTPDEANGFACLLFMAGHETTTLLSVNCIDQLARDPAALWWLRAGGSPAAFVDEMLRHRPSVHRVTRYAARATMIAGHAVPAGAPVRFLIASANRDMTRFADPERFDPDRRGSPHAGFGFGMHICMGSWLARLELRLMLEHIAATTGSIVASGERIPVTGGAFATSGLTRLDLSVSPRSV